MNPIVIFTDLDGTLLDHEDYSYQAAKPCLDYLYKNHIPLIFTSSKTAVEIEKFCLKTNFYHPYIAENGGLLSVPKDYFNKNKKSTKEYIRNFIGVSRGAINQTLNYFVDTYKFRSFSQMDINELVEHTGLSKQQAVYANQRNTTEPLVWLDDERKLSKFAEELKQYDLILVSGGRFHHVMGIHDKATTMSILIEKFSTYYMQQITSIALGDSPNDLQMLKNATYGIVIPNPYAPKMCIENHANLQYAKKIGPQGWNNALLDLLKELLA